MPRRDAVKIWQDALFRGAQAMLRMKNEHARDHRLFNLWSDAIEDTLATRLSGRDRRIAQSHWWHLAPNARIEQMSGGDRSFEEFKLIARAGSSALRARSETQNRTPS